LNEAFNTLRDPASRILHLLALSGEKPQPKAASAGVSAWFGIVATDLQRFDRMFQPLSQVTSSLLRAVKFREAQAVLADLERISDGLASEKEGLLKTMAEIDASWPNDRATDRDSLAQIASDLRFLEKWLAQINERRLRLASIAP
jgi:DnaJ-domain-containing protein 1